MLTRHRVYQAGLSAMRPAVAVLSPFNEKLSRGSRGRSDAVQRLVTYGNSARGTEPLVWVHAPSVGESLMAQAIVAALRERMAGVQIAFTHFSPSAERMRDLVGADFAGYLPWDLNSDMRRVLDALKPSAIAFVRTEIWPTLVGLAHARKIPALLVNAVLAPNSSRLTPLAKYFLGPAYAQLVGVGAVNTITAERFRQLVPPGRVRVTGDSRFDQVWNRIGLLDREQPMLARLRDSTSTLTVVAGSTWPSDEEHLIRAMISAGKAHPLRLIIAPHEPKPSRIQALEGELRKAGLSAARLDDVEKSNDPLPKVIVVERMGILADLYSIADLAYVGGGFGDAGLHSVVEPAGLGVPVLFGPRHANAPEADELAGRGGGFVVRDAASITSVLHDQIQRPDARRAASVAAKEYVRSRLGAAQRNAQLIAERIGG